MTNRVRHVTLGLLTMLVMVVAGYFVLAFIGSTIPQNPGWREPESGVEILVETNGTHTGIVMPVVTAQKDWRLTFPSAGEPLPGGQMPTHIAIGYGEREVFLGVPTWGDLTAGTALRIASLGGDSLIRVSHYLRPAPSASYRPLRITPAQYDRLARSIEAQLPPMPPTGRTIFRDTYSRDGYYTARGRYTLGNTCNEWVGERLTEAGLPMGLWTPLASGVTKWIPLPAEQSAT